MATKIEHSCDLCGCLKELKGIVWRPDYCVDHKGAQPARRDTIKTMGCFEASKHICLKCIRDIAAIARENGL